MNVIERLKGIFRFWRPVDPPVPFSVLFKKFKSILGRNNAILELMADMGDKLGGEYVFDRQYILGVCEEMTDLVFKLISDLCVLSQTDNVELFIAFERIQHEIQEELAGRRAFPMVRPAILLDDLNGDLNEEAGNKFANLGDLRNTLGLQTPEGFVITTKAFFDFMDYNGILKVIDESLERWDRKNEETFDVMCKDVRRRIVEGTVPRAMASHISAMVDILATRGRRDCLRFAVRSSAWGEDSEFSFAGQYESVLNVARNGIPDAYRQVVASAYTPEAWRYRLHRGYKEHETAIAVGCQLMASAKASGAIYTYAPLPTEKESMVISSAWGLGPAVVGGLAESDTLFLDRASPHEVLSIDVGHKTTMMISATGGGTEWVDVPEAMRDAQSLTADESRKLAQTAMVIERYYKRPQDVEWAFDTDGNLSILQSRSLNVRPERRPEVRVSVDDKTLSSRVVFSGLGTVVQRGIALGKVYLALSDEDLKDFPYGAILVTRYTSPKYSRVMRKAHGIITDIGSATGHMATLAREYRVPAVVNTGMATKMLEMGQEITLDANQNVVYRGTVMELSRFEFMEQEVFEESYEYRLLRRLLKKIAPLNLVDSHGEEFKPGRCRTYHDITRFIHEKAVEKLIDLSENYRKYHDQIPKRLESELPLGLVVIDIENGVSVPRQAETVTVEGIASVPMRALLDGLLESGMWTTNPVAVDMGSFMSSLTRTSSMSSPGKMDRNLAVISKEYMNLNLRLGYHFTIVDSYVGDASNDNYISFRFLGGVTDITRRSRRARFIAEVLEYLDFRVEVHGDLVAGRIKKASKDRMCSTLRVLGGLIGYTRQLDVNMDNDEQVGLFFTDFTQRIRSFSEVHDGCTG